MNLYKSSFLRAIKTRLENRWIIALILIAFIFVMFLGWIPYLIRNTAVEWINEASSDKAAIKDIDFNPFTGTLKIHEMIIKSDREEGLNKGFHIGLAEFNMDWIPLLNKRVYLKKIKIQDTDITIQKEQNSGFMIGGIRIPAKAQDSNDKEGANKAYSNDKPWGIGIASVQIMTTHVSYEDQGFQVNALLENFESGPILSWQQEGFTEFDLKMKINDSPLAFTGKASIFSIEPELKSYLKVTNLALAPFSPLLASQNIMDFHGEIDVDTDVKAIFTMDGYLDLGLEGRLVIKGLHGKHSDNILACGEIDWNGNTSLSISLPKGKDLSIEQEGFNTIPSGVNLNQTVSRTGHNDPELNDIIPSNKYSLKKFNMKADLVMDDISIENPDRDLILLQLAKLTVNDIRVERHDRIMVCNVQTDDARILCTDVDSNQESSEENNPMTTNTIQLEKPETKSMTELKIENIKLFNLHGTLVRYADEGWSLIDDFVTKKTEPIPGEKPKPVPEERLEPIPERKSEHIPDEESERVYGEESVPAEGSKGSNSRKSSAISVSSGKSTIENKKPVIFSIETLEVLGDSSLIFEDRSIRPNFLTKLYPFKLVIKKLNNSDIDIESHMELFTKIDEYTTINIDAKGYLFMEKPNLSMSSEIQSMDLPPLSPYTAQYLGYHLQSGHLNADIKIDILRGELQGNTQLFLSNLKITPADNEKMDNMLKQLSMPLDSALSLLRDKNDNISLKLPVTGDINNPKFDITDAINKALGKAIKVAAFSYLKYALHPYGAMISVAKYAGKLATAVRLDPLYFSPGSSEIEDSANSYLKQVGNLMKDRSKIRLRICGKATEIDRKTIALKAANALQKGPASVINQEGVKGEKRKSIPQEGPSKPPSLPEITDKQLLDLAHERSSIIKEYLVKQHGIEAERLFICNPEIEKDEDARPQVEILI